MASCKGVDEFLLRAESAYVDRQLLPANLVDGAELELDMPVVAHFDLIYPARAGLARVPALGIARINHRGRLLVQHLARMHMAERPIVDAAVPQVVQRAGSVGGVPPIIDRIGVQ